MEGDRLLPTHKLSFSPSSKDAAECNNPAELASYPSKKSRNFQLRHHIFYIAICAVCLFIGFFASLTINSRHVRPQNNSDPQITCHSPATRREWRSLSDNEKGQYIRAVVCLSTKPSRLGTNNSLYDDFALVHHESDENGESPSSIQARQLILIWQYILLLLSFPGTDTLSMFTTALWPKNVVILANYRTSPHLLRVDFQHC
jgi:hypothetical protein